MSLFSEKCFARMVGLKRGWNGYGAFPPNAQAIARARRVIEILEENGLEPDRVAPTAVDGVFIGIINDDGREVIIECYNIGSTFSMMSNKTDDPIIDCLDTEDGELDESKLRHKIPDYKKYLGR